MPTDPLDQVFGKLEALEGENRARLAKLIVPFAMIDADSGTVGFKKEASKLTPKQKVLVFLLSRLALSARNPAFSAALSPKEIQDGLSDMPGGTLRPKLGDLVKDRVVQKDEKSGLYAIRPSSLGRAEALLEDVLPKEVEQK